MTPAFLIFHLNLAYSSIEVDQRPTVIQQCYEPLLDLIENQDLCVGIETSSWTLRTINDLYPEWVIRLRHLIQAEKCELIGSGYVQLIGPLVPYEVNVWNQRLGIEDYQDILSLRPQLALVNELAYSSGMVGVYQEAGYEGIIMDRDNVAVALGLTDNEAAMPAYADGGAENTLPVLWSDSILFQKFQHYAHGDIGITDYLEYFRRRAVKGRGPLAVYGNDAEIFDYRPGRFKVESKIKPDGEWLRIGHLLRTLTDQEAVTWLAPSRALELHKRGQSSQPVPLISAHQPIPVKKQAKYNISRWAITGRDDLWINTLCHRIYRQLHLCKENDNQDRWRSLCQLWASDLRTHVTPSRWDVALGNAEALKQQLKLNDTGQTQETWAALLLEKNEVIGQENCQIEYDPESIYITVVTKSVNIILNMRRGLAIHSLGFKTHNFSPVVGTLPLGYFSSIELGADFYSGGVVIERVKEHCRTTDLNWVKPEILQREDQCLIRGIIDSDCGQIIKTICIGKNSETVAIHYDFPQWQRPYGSVRVGNFTFLPESFSSPLYYRCRNGGSYMEEFELNTDTLHTSPSSSLVSASTGLGATDGEILVGDKTRMLRFQWDPAQCATFPMVYHKECQPNALTRLVFSLAELDETRVEGGKLLPLSIRLEPVLIA